MELLENENIITESANKQVMLTSYRIRFRDSISKKSNFTSIMLDKISSIGVTYQSNVWLLIIGILTIPIFVGVILIILFFISRKHVVSISSDGGSSIVFETKGMKREFLEEFIDKIENASIKLKKI